MTIEKAWKRRQETKERLLELADRAPSERFWQASNADDDAVLAAMLAAFDLGYNVARSDATYSGYIMRPAGSLARARLAALKSPAEGEKEPHPHEWH